MKKFVFFLPFLLLSSLFLSYCATALSFPSAKDVSEVIRKAVPTEFGYLDNTEYYMQYYFSDLSYVDDSCIVICAESSNFNEFGVFHVKDPSDTKLCEKQVKSYLSEAKERFKSGVIYDIDQYPKFENAKIVTIGSYVIYTILDPSESKRAIEEIKKTLAK